LKSPLVLHSPFSPLSASSPLYPDGIIGAQWIEKHQEQVPSILVRFYRLTSDPTLASLRDNELKTDISQLRTALSKSGYRTRLAVILLSDVTASPLSGSDGIQERLDNIRKGTGQDPKALFYIAPRETAPELEQAADTILTALFSQSIEYYRDIGRHARKKRSRGVAPQPTIPPTSGTSQTLSLQGWNVRYDFKAGVFAEFRQEMDTALRSYEQAYDGLLSAELLDIIPSWSPRWNEARLLADMLSIRSIRCLLWLGQTTGAVRRWQSHRDRIADFIDRRGRGTNNYGWKAWEARWAVVMANIMERAELQGLVPATGTLFLQPEKAVMGERLLPWELLHHTGYWYRLAARHLAARRSLAYSMTEEDRRPPDTTTSTSAVSKSYTFDSYLCPEPHEEYPLDQQGVNHSQLIIDCLMSARSQFLLRQQARLSAELSLECAKEMVRLQAWEDAVAVLRPLWEDMTFRAEGWVDIAEDLGWVLRHAAERAGVADIVVAIDWELMHRSKAVTHLWHYSFANTDSEYTRRRIWSEW
jgi:trafficking protein particle complex subunit 11